MPARTMPCPNCGAPVAPEAAACDACGQPIPVAGGRTAAWAALPPEPSAEAAVAVDAGPPAEAAASPIPGAWLPPSSVHRPGQPFPAATSAPPAAPPMTRPEPGAAARPGEAPLLADLPFDAPSDLPGWLVLVGGGLASVAFVLPWAPLVFDFYWDSWGLGSVERILVFLVAAVTTALAILPNRVGSWLRFGVLGLVVGGLGLGLTLPYLFGDFDVPLGVIVEAVGAVLLVAGGVVAARPSRAGASPEA